MTPGASSPLLLAPPPRPVLAPPVLTSLLQRPPHPPPILIPFAPAQPSKLVLIAVPRVMTCLVPGFLWKVAES